MMKRILALVLSASIMLSNLAPMTAFARDDEIYIGDGAQVVYVDETQPTEEPVVEPIVEPTVEPTEEPQPTEDPVETPVELEIEESPAPTEEPVEDGDLDIPVEPTVEPSVQPTEEPVGDDALIVPSAEPTVEPTPVVDVVSGADAPMMETAPQAETLFEKLLAAETLEELNSLLNSDTAVFELTADEIDALFARVDVLDPDGINLLTEEIVDTLISLPNFTSGAEEDGEEAAMFDTTISTNQNWQGGGNISSNATWTFVDGKVVTLEEPETILSGVTLTLKGWGSIARHSSNKDALFIIQAGGKLVIEGTSTDKPFIIDGKDVIANASLIISSGELNFTNAKIQNGKNRSVYPADHKNAGKPNGQGGGITVDTAGSLTMNNCVVTKNTASLNGGGIHSTGPMTISNSEISWNRAMSTETGNPNVNAGRGGGFNLSGENGDAVFDNVLITENAAMYYGGGGQVTGSGSSLEIKNGTLFSNNTAVLHGAGALHLTADATFTMNGGNMENNFAQYCGGAIHSSYSCVLNMNSGTIKNNVTNGRGGGIHINTGGAITLKEGITISGNEAYNKTTGYSADVDATGDNWSNIKYNATSEDFGYGGGILMDSGTCTVAGATITDNYAEVGGGGIALTMLNMGEGGLDDYMVISFTMTSGTVSNNKTDGDGAGVYIMTNKAEDNLKKEFTGKNTTEAGEVKDYQWALDKITATNKHGFTGEQIINGIPEALVSGGTIKDNIASDIKSTDEPPENGGGLYLDNNTKFIIEGTGDISENEATNGGGVYVKSGTAEINGGTMKANNASDEGGALYINGNVTMTAGTIGGDNETDANTAANGGALYVKDGNVTIEHGTIDGNKAIATGDLQDTSNDTGRGGAVYLAGNENTLLTMESGTMSNNNAANDGGAIFATGGTIKIGLEACKLENTDEELGACTHHTALGAERHHPVIGNNKAGDTGGGIALEDGKVYFYCGKAKENEALYKGVGKNAFMNGGEFFLYDGADIGIPRDPDLVIIGGKLHNECVNKEYYNLYYYQHNTDTETKMHGLAEYEEIMNLTDGEYFWQAESGYRFVGWTAQGAASGNQSHEFVRNKDQYVNSGEPVQILDAVPSEIKDNTAKNTEKLFDGETDKDIHLYAIWAPIVNNITYVDSMDDTKKVHAPATYTMPSAGSGDDTIIINQPSTGDALYRAGYEVVGWYIYQDEGQNANWSFTDTSVTPAKFVDYDPKYIDNDDKGYDTLDLNPEKINYLQVGADGNLNLTIPEMTFGDITLVAIYEELFGNITITKSGANETLDPSQTFIFTVTGTPDNTDRPEVTLTVAINGNGSITLPNLPIGTYTVTEDEDWSWRYTAEDKDQTVTLTTVNKDKTVTFVNTREIVKWLDGNSWAQNLLNNKKLFADGSDVEIA